jgi:hypothetical protein
MHQHNKQPEFCINNVTRESRYWCQSTVFHKCFKLCLALPASVCPPPAAQAEATFDNGSLPVQGSYPTTAAADDRLYCSSCDWHCTLEAQMRSHLSSSRHKLKLLVQQVCLTLSKAVTLAA